MAALTPVFIDFETFWDTGHSLSKMSPMKYVMHPDTEIISCSAKVGKEATYCSFGEDLISRQIKRFDWSDKFVIAHNMSGFDSMILAWRLGVRPAMWGCTLAMARPIHAKTTGLSLEKLVEHYGLGKKDKSALIKTKGKHLKDFTTEELAAMKQYNIDDTEQCAGLFYKLLKQTNKDELRLIDMTIRMLVEPQFEVDRELLETALAGEKTRKHQMLLNLASMLGIETTLHTDDEIAESVAKTLGSSAKFAALLETLKIEPPKKISLTTGKETYALAKTDEGFIALTEHDDPIVAAAANARLGVKSTLLETRIEVFLEASSACGGRLPIPLHYYGADTTGRWSGWAYNPQNLPRVGKDPKPSDALRMCLRAGKGKKVVVADLSGIELRVNMFLWKVPYAMALFQADPEKADLYKELASEVLGVPKEDMPKMIRQAGKAMHLGCGFGLASTKKYVGVAKQMAQIVVTEDEAATHIAGYRAKHPEIVRGWKTCHASLDAIYAGIEVPIDPWGLCHTTKGGIITPKGMIRYPDLRKETNDEGKTEWVYGNNRSKSRIYAGKIDENIVQHLARGVIADNALTVKRETGYTPALTVHDELVYITPDSEASDLLAVVQNTMRTPPSWWPELITWSEGDVADTYGEAK